eukprot:904721_1
MAKYNMRKHHDIWTLGVQLFTLFQLQQSPLREYQDEVITIPTRNAPGNDDGMVEKRLESSLDANEVQYEQIARSYEELTAFEGDIFDDYVSKIGMYSFPEILMGKTDKKATDRDKKKVYEIPNESGIKRFELYHRGYVDVHLAYEMDIIDKINPLIYYDPCDTNDMKLRDISSVNEVDEEWDYRNEDAARKVGIDKELEQSKPSMHDMQSIPSTSAPQIGTIKNTLTDTILQNGLKDRTESIDINPNDLSRPLLIEHYQLHYSERVNSTTSHGEVRRQYKERDVKLFEDLVCEYNVNSTPPKTEDHDSSLVSNKKAKREQLASQSLREEENRAYVDDLDVHRESRMKYKVKMASLNPEIEGINAERKAMNEHDVCRLDHDSVMDALNDVVQLEDFLYLCETYVDHEDSDPDYAVRFDANDCEESEQGKLEREDNQDEMFNIGGFDYSTQEEEEIDLNSTEFCKESEEALAVVRRVAKIGQQSLVNSVCNMRNDWVDEEPNEQQLSQSDEQSDEHNLSKSEAPEHDLPSDYASKEEEVKDNGEENLIDESESEVKVFEEEEKLAWNKEEMIKSEPFEREWKDGALIKIKTDNVGKSDQLILPKFVAACEQILITDNVYLVDDFDRMRAYHSDPQTSQIKKQQKQENEEEFNGKEAVQERCAMLHFEDENSEYYGDAMNEIDKKANDIFCNAFHIKPVQLIDLNANTFLHLMTKQKFGMTKEVVQSLRYVSDTRMTNKNGHTFLQIAAKNNQEYIYRAVMDDSSLYGSNVIQIKEGQCVIQRVVHEKEPDYAGAAYLVIKCSIPLDEEVVSREELSTKYEEQKAKRGDKMRQLENAHVDTQEENDRDCEDETLGWIVTKVHYDPKKRGKPLYNIMNSITAATHERVNKGHIQLHNKPRESYKQMTEHPYNKLMDLKRMEKKKIVDDKVNQDVYECDVECDILAIEELNEANEYVNLTTVSYSVTALKQEYEKGWIVDKEEMREPLTRRLNKVRAMIEEVVQNLKEEKDQVNKGKVLQEDIRNYVGFCLKDGVPITIKRHLIECKKRRLIVDKYAIDLVKQTTEIIMKIRSIHADYVKKNLWIGKILRDYSISIEHSVFELNYALMRKRKVRVLCYQKMKQIAVIMQHLLVILTKVL